MANKVTARFFIPMAFFCSLINKLLRRLFFDETKV